MSTAATSPASHLANVDAAKRAAVREFVAWLEERLNEVAASGTTGEVTARITFQAGHLSRKSHLEPPRLYPPRAIVHRKA